jgi:hypothetical protein
MIPVDPNHLCTKFWAEDDRRKVPVLWGTLDLLLNGPWSKRAARRTHAGICGYSHRIFYLSANLLFPLVVHDIYISPQRGCEEGRRCLARQCPLNRTGDDWLRKFLHRRANQPVPEKINVSEPQFCHLFEKKPDRCGILLEEKSTRGVRQPAGA